MPLNRERYLDRIGYPHSRRARLQPDLECLRELTRLHTQSIPFENLDTLMREPVRLDIDSIEAKLVDARRGGYCFEQNALFAAALEDIGYAVTPLAARVVWGLDPAARRSNPRTHMVLLLALAETRYLCDVGFGGVTPTAPLVLGTAREQQTPHEPFRVVDDAGSFVLQVAIGGQWCDVYDFDLQPQAPSDYEMANHYVATHPASRFRNTLIAARAFEGGRHMLRNARLTTHVAGTEKVQRELDGPEALLRTLEVEFGIHVNDPEAVRAGLANIDE